MASSPYREPAEAVAEPPLVEAPSHSELAGAAGFAWLATLARILVALARAEAPNRELELAWLVLLVAPIVIWKELASRRPPPG